MEAVFSSETSVNVYRTTSQIIIRFTVTAVLASDPTILEDSATLLRVGRDQQFDKQSHIDTYWIRISAQASANIIFFTGD
jgi:hypothetical protein